MVTFASKHAKYLGMLLCCGVFYSSLTTVSLAQEAMTSEARNGLMRQMAEAVKKAGIDYQGGKLKDAAQELVVAMDFASNGLQGADEILHGKAAPYLDRIERAHALLQLEGIVLPPFDRPEFGSDWNNYAEGLTSVELPLTSAAGTGDKGAIPGSDTPAKSRRPARSRRPMEMASPEGPSGISFVNQVAPILANHCGRCHIQARRGNLTLESYAAIMQGPSEGVIVFAGDPIGSRLIETIETGDMPRGGGKVPADQLQVLKDWVTQGAKFDGPDATMPLVSLASAAVPGSRTVPPMDADKPMVATGKETVSFSKQVAPLLVANCTGCHIDAMQVRGGLNMGTLASLLRGGDSGEIVDTADAMGSLLIRKLRGEEGARMPAGGRPPLDDASIELISTWIAEGALLDSGAMDQPLPVLASEAWARYATDDELSERRRELATKNWILGAPTEVQKLAVQFENQDVYVVGGVRQAEAELVAAAASAALSKVRSQLPEAAGDKKSKGASANASSSGIKGKISVFLFPRRYDYSEFSKMVEKRDVPSSWDTHWRYDGVDAYISIVVNPGDDAKVLQARLAAPMASLLVASRGASPRWFREGLGRAIAVKAGGRDFELAKVWDAGLPEALLSIKDAKDLMEERLPPEQADLIGYGLCSTMLDRMGRRQLEVLLNNLAGGDDFAEQFLSAFKMTPEDFLTSWLVGSRSQR